MVCYAAMAPSLLLSSGSGIASIPPSVDGQYMFPLLSPFSSVLYTHRVLCPQTLAFIFGYRCMQGLYSLLVIKSLYKLFTVMNTKWNLFRGVPMWDSA